MEDLIPIKKKCIAKHCSSYFPRKQRIIIHRLPKDIQRCKEWLVAVKREDLFNKSDAQLRGYRVCSNHFRSSDYLNKSVCKRLVWNAVPSLNIGTNDESLIEPAVPLLNEEPYPKDMNLMESSVLLQNEVYIPMDENMVEFKFLDSTTKEDLSSAIHSVNTEDKYANINSNRNLQPRRLNCIAKHCGNIASRNRKVIIHRLPRDIQRCKKWLVAMKREDLLIKSAAQLNSYYVCSNHFRCTDYLNKSVCKRLVWNAVPSLNLEENVMESTFPLSNMDSYSMNTNAVVQDEVLYSRTEHDLPSSGHSINFEDRSHFQGSLGALPENLTIRQSFIHKNLYGIWSLEDITKGTRFGPYNGALIDNYEWKQGTKSQDNTNAKQNSSNWLAYVNHAFTIEQQNLIIVKFKDEIFYITCIDIPANNELLAGYTNYGQVTTSTTNSSEFPLQEASHKSQRHEINTQNLALPDCLITQDMAHTINILYEYGKCINEFEDDLNLHKAIYSGERSCERYKYGEKFAMRKLLHYNKPIYAREKFNEFNTYDNTSVDSEIVHSNFFYNYLLTFDHFDATVPENSIQPWI